MTNRRAIVLLVEDSIEDQIIVTRALEDGRIACDLHIAENGEKALKMLRGEQPYETEFNKLPDIILMDINMPAMNGKEALARIRKDPGIKHLPVVMLTTSNRDKDILESYQLGVNAYLTKPVRNTDFIEAIRKLENFWFEVVALPSSSLF